MRRAYGKLTPVRTELAADANAARAPAAGGVELVMPSGALPVKREASPPENAAARKKKRGSGIAALAVARDAAQRTTEAARELAAASNELVENSALFAKRVKTHEKQMLVVAHKGSGGPIQLRILSAVAKSGAIVALNAAQLEPTRLEVGESSVATLWAKSDDLLSVVRVAVDSSPRALAAHTDDGCDEALRARRSVWCVCFDRRRGWSAAHPVESARHAVLKWKGGRGVPRSGKRLVRQKGALGTFSNGMRTAESVDTDPTMESCGNLVT